MSACKSSCNHASIPRAHRLFTDVPLAIAYHVTDLNDPIDEASFKPVYTDRFISSWTNWDHFRAEPQSSSANHRCAEIDDVTTFWRSQQCTDSNTFACAVAPFGKYVLNKCTFAEVILGHIRDAHVDRSNGSGGADAKTKWVANKNRYTTSHAADVTVARYTVSECLSFCEQGFPPGCKSVVHTSSGECQFWTVHLSSLPGVTLAASDDHDLYELQTDGTYVWNHCSKHSRNLNSLATILNTCTRHVLAFGARYQHRHA